MKPALLLIDLQNDFLANSRLVPCAGAVIERAAALLAECRRARIPVVHVQTTVHRRPDDRMAHWRIADRWICEAGTPGHDPPGAIAPARNEIVIHKQVFNAFAQTPLHDTLRREGCDTLILAGVHTHACIRTAALEAYERGFRVLIAEDAVGSDDPLHAAITRRYLAQRAIDFLAVAGVTALLAGAQDDAQPFRSYIHHKPANLEEAVWSVPLESPGQVRELARRAQEAWRNRRATSIDQRAEALRHLADELDNRKAQFAERICIDVGKPITLAQAEVHRGVELLRVTADQATAAMETPTGPHTIMRRAPLGVVALITPWNNPLAIPLGKIAPALLYDNAVLWKPALAGMEVARLLLERWRHVGGAELLFDVTGDAACAAALAEDASVDAVTLTGSQQAGQALQEICVRRCIPFQGELGGNNAAIIGDDADLAHAAQQIAPAAFGYAGQRCTANRRVIVGQDRLRACVEALEGAMRRQRWGDPQDSSTVIGPVISLQQRRRLEALLARAQGDGLRIVPYPAPPVAVENGAYATPAIVVCEDPAHEIVQEESFGPILVVQPARSFDHSLELLNGVRQGLAAALFSHDQRLQRCFLREARAGILKINLATADADAVSPFGGWKSSGIGPPEHGPADREFFTRAQSVYGLAP